MRFGGRRAAGCCAAPRSRRGRTACCSCARISPCSSPLCWRRAGWPAGCATSSRGASHSWSCTDATGTRCVGAPPRGARAHLLPRRHYMLLHLRRRAPASLAAPRTPSAPKQAAGAAQTPAIFQPPRAAGAEIARCCGQGSVRVPWPRSPRQHTHAMRCSGHRSEPCSALRVLRADCNAACGRKLTCDAASAAQAPRLWRGPGGHR